MGKYMIIIHDDKFKWTVTAVSDQRWPIADIENRMMREGIKIHEYVDGKLFLTIDGEKFEYYDEEEEI